MSGDRTYTLKELAELTGKSQSTIQRKKKRLIAEGASCTASGWAVTQTQAEAVGLTFIDHPDRSYETSPDHPDDHHSSELIDALRAHIASLEESLQREHKRVSYLESQLDQERKERLLWTQGYLSETRALEEAPTVSTPEVHTQEQPSTHKPAPRTFLRRFFRQK